MGYKEMLKILNVPLGRRKKEISRFWREYDSSIEIGLTKKHRLDLIAPRTEYSLCIEAPRLSDFVLY